ncbi:MAG: FtsH protease activity modulator HflK [Planctomycetota bacterium]
MNAKSSRSLPAEAVLGALRGSSRAIRWGVTVLVLLYLASGVHRVAPNESALVLRFGKLQPQVHTPGLLFAWPPPVDEVIRVPVRSALEILLDDWGAPPEGSPAVTTMHPVRDGYTLTGDANVVHARLSVRYQIVDPVAAVFATQQREALSEAVLYQSLARVLARTSVDAALTTDRDLVRQETQRLAQQELDRLGLGLQLAAVEFRELLPARPVLPAFQEVVSAQVEARVLSQQAESYRAETLPGAQAEAYRVRQEAMADQHDRIARAKGEAQSFKVLLAESRQSPAVTRARLWAETWEVVAPKLQTTTVLPDTPGQLWLPAATGDRP